jgi:cytochrome c553
MVTSLSRTRIGSVVAAGALAAGLIVATMSVAVPASTGDPAAGKKILGRCTACHGLNGIGKAPDVPNLAGESPVYLTKQLKAYRAGERQHEQMSIIAKRLSDVEIDNLAAWYAALKVKVELPKL